MYKIGHRGACAYEAENTISSFKKAYELGANMVELDVRLSRDGVIMVSHDSDISKYTAGSGFIENISCEDIQQYAIKENPAENIPSLKEVFAELSGKGGIYIEIKGEYMEDRLVYLLKEENFAGEIIVGSFDAEKIKKVKELDKSIRTSLLTDNPYSDFISETLRVGADYVHLCWREYDNPHNLVQDFLVEHLREYGLGIIIWNEERTDILKELKKKDVDGICSNKPELL